MNRKIVLFTLLATAFIFTFLSSKALAGWVEVNRQAGTTTYISDGMVKQMVDVEGSPWTLFDADRGIITVVDPRGSNYMEIDPEKICDELSKMMNAMTEAMPPEQRAAMEQMMSEKASTQKVPVVAVSRVGNGGEIAGQNTDKYSVTVDGKPYKEVWLAVDSPIMEDARVFTKSAMDLNKQVEGCKQIGALSATLVAMPESSKEYMALMEKGWRLKEVDMRSGSVQYEVESLTKKDIPASDFKVPANYEKLDMMEMIGRMGMGR